LNVHPGTFPELALAVLIEPDVIALDVWVEDQVAKVLDSRR
jgi:hypothetical protein